LPTIIHLIFYLFFTAFIFRQGLIYTWNKQLTVISDRSFIGSNGYSHRYVSCSDFSFDNNIISYLLPPLALEKIKVNGLDLLYTLIQRTTNQTVNFLQFNILPGAYIAMKYLENRYITLL